MSQFNINTTCYKEERSVTVQGTVYDTNTREALPFANIYLTNNSTVGTSTNDYGEFTIEIPYGSSLTVSYVGYNNYEFEAKEGFTKVFLAPDDQLGTVYLEGENKKRKNGWLWWLAIGGAIVAASTGSKDSPKTKKPIKARI